MTISEHIGPSISQVNDEMLNTDLVVMPKIDELYD